MGERAGASRPVEGLAAEASGRFPRSQRRARRNFTKEDDAALVKGHAKYGALWHKIRDDPDLNLSTRKATDLRDRLRNVHPELFSKSDFKGNPRVTASTSLEPSETLNLRSSAREPAAMREDTTYMQIDAEHNASSATSQAHQSQELLKESMVPSLDSFFTDPLSVGDDANLFEESTSPIILSRTILDWGEHNAQLHSATDPPPWKNVAAATAAAEQPEGIDPLVTVQGYSSSTALPSSAARVSASSLPSVAALAVADKSEAFSLPPLSETLMPFDMTVGGLLWDEYE